MSEEQAVVTGADNSSWNGRSASPAPSDVSMKSDRSKGEPLNFSNVPGPPGNEKTVSPSPSNVSMKSDWSKGEPLNFSNVTPGPPGNEKQVSPSPSNVSMKSDWSKGEPLNNTEPSSVQSQRPQPSNAITKNSQSEDDPLNRKKRSDLKKRILSQYEEELRKHETDTELYEIKPVKDKKDEEKLENYNEIFKASQKERTVLMKGVPGIGKTFQTRRFMVDWAKGNSNQDIDLIVSFNFSELNSKGAQSMEELLNHFFNDAKQQRLPTFDKCKVAFVLDGLEECQLPLEFENNKHLTNIKEKASMDVLLTNLIKGNLLRSACLWIISRPSGVDKIPPEYIQKVTECRESSKRRKQLVSDLRNRFLTEYNRVEDINHPNQKNTEHIIRNDSTGEVNDEEKHGKTVSNSVAQVNAISDIFKEGRGQKIRTVLTKGESGIGKSFHVQKFIKEWAENKKPFRLWNMVTSLWSKASAEEIIVPLDFSKLVMIKKKVSLVELLNHLFEETQKSVISDYAHFKVLFVLDGLDTDKLPLDFEKSDILTDVRQPASVGVLLTDLIKGNLLPSARLWITSRPSSLQRLPDSSFDRVTEIREKDAKQKLRDHLKGRILSQYEEELRKHETDTELYEIKSVKDKEDEEKNVQNYNEIFKASQKERTVLMKGVPGIGKTFQTRRFMVDWANGNSNQDIDLIVSFHFSKLNSKVDQSMEDLLNHFFNDAKQQRLPTFDKCKVAFVLDGLEECQLPLDFENNQDLTNIKDKASMDVLLTNLIKRNLLPSACLWIISRPSGVDKIPPEYIQKVTECRESSKRRKQLESDLRKRFLTEYTHVEDINHPNQKNTEHIIRNDNTGEVNNEEKHRKTQVNAISDIFKEGRGQKIRTVLTKGESDIGKSFHVQKFIKEWAENKKPFRLWNMVTSLWRKASAEEIIVPLDFSKLVMIKKKVSLVELLNHLFEETQKSVISDYAHFKVLFVLDGLDTDQLPLDSEKSDILTDVREPASGGVLLTNLIKGNLLPSARLWITSRPSSLQRLPDSSFDRVTEIREKPDLASQRKLKSHLKEQFTRVSEGIDKQKTSALLNEIYTDLYIIEGERGEVNAQHESRQVQEAKFKPVKEETPIKYHDIFKPVSAENKPIKSVLTIGVAGIGKTFASMKYMLDWAEGMANENIYYTFPLPFRELNLRKENEHSLEELIHQFFPVMKTSEIKDYDKYQILIVLDGLDECRLDLNFSESMDWTDVREKTSVNVLLANLIKGNLLPKAQIWITSRPAASNSLPADKVDRVTEVRGFSDDQKEEYFRKRFSDKDLAVTILSHVKKSRSLYIMCHIPVFCWITSKVLEDFVSRNLEEGMPKTLTDMYIHFLLLQCRQANVKYGGEETSDSSETDSYLTTWNKDTILSLGKLAFNELEKGNPLFTEENLKDCGIDIEKTAVFSGLLTQIKREGCRLYQNNFFCFVHLSIQEFLAAFHVTYTFNNKGENLLTKPASGADFPASNIYKTAVDKALESKNGDWDLFLRFLLGLSLETNQNLLQELLQKTENNKQRNKETVEYIKGKISEEISDADKNLNLFHCLNELNDHSLVKEVKKYLQSETQSFENFSTSQWSALTYVLLISDEKLDVFDLKKYLKSEKVLLGMLPVVKVSKTTLLSWCELSEESCKGLTSSVLSSASSNLMELDLSHNDLLDSGVELLADGLKSLHCKLEILKLSGCQVTEKGCSALVSALKSNTASHLKQLDLSYNHPGDEGERMLCALTEDSNAKLKTLSLDHGGAHRLKPGLKKYSADLKFDENTVSRRLVLSEGNKTVKTVKKVEEKVKRSENDDRFKRTQVFCDEGLKGLYYWEVEWRGTVGIAVSYRDVSRKWDSSGGLGCNKNSWSLICSKDGYTARHENKSEYIKMPLCQKIGLLLDWEAGTLHYYSVTTGKLSLIHTFHAKFTKPLFPGFWFKKGSVTLCELD